MVMIDKEIRVWLSQGAIAATKLVMEYKITEIDLRGRVGLACNEQPGVYFDEIEVKE